MGPGIDENSFLRDFFFEMFKDSDNLRVNYQLDRDAWFRKLQLPRKQERLFELEMYLRAFGVFFNLHNQFPSHTEQAITSDFSQELQVLSAAMDRGIALSQLLLDRGMAGTMNFRSYLENQVAPDYLRLQILKRGLDQKGPDESLHLLNRCLRDLKKVSDHLLKRPPSTYMLFYHFGQVVTREIAFNKHFNPLLILEFRPEYDRIRSVPIIDALQSISNRAERNAASRIFLGLFRLLHYLRYIPRQGSFRMMRRSLILFTLFYSEANTLAGYLKVLGSKSSDIGQSLGVTCLSMAREIQKKLQDILGERTVRLDINTAKLEGKHQRSVEDGRKQLESFVKEAIASFVGLYGDDDIEKLFDSSVNQQQQSVRLRSDLWIFIRLVDDAIVQLEQHKTIPKDASGKLLKFSEYFLETSYNFLRYADGEPFEQFAQVISDGARRSGSNGVLRTRFMEDTVRFRNLISETYEQICCRDELKKLPLNHVEMEQAFKRWLGSREA